MKYLKNRAFLLILAILLSFSFVTGCEDSDSSSVEQPNKTTLNGVDISAYTIIYSAEEPDYNKRAAEYIESEIKARTGIDLEVKKDSEGNFPYEIIVGETDREISESLDADTVHSQFAILANDTQIAMEGDFFVIAAAAYFFVRTYIPAAHFESNVPKSVSIHEPIVEEADNFIFLIGDGMGLYQTLLFDALDAPMTGANAFSDGEDVFYGYYLPYFGMARTNSLNGLTDSAAAGTALSTGQKTKNGRIAMDSQAGRSLKTLTELAGSRGKKTAVMSTEASTGATPASFSAHATAREDSEKILSSQSALTEKYGTIIRCNYDYYTKSKMRGVERAITETLTSLSNGENGFFLMYEEAHIDKHCHNNDLQNTFLSVLRFNQAIGLFMEYAFYHPNTVVVITADHETGGLVPSSTSTDANRSFSYTSGGHTTNFVPVFAYGAGMEVFDGKLIENVQIPKTIAYMWGTSSFGSNSASYPILK